jgi:hypothetical protein
MKMMVYPAEFSGPEKKGKSQFKRVQGLCERGFYDLAFTITAETRITELGLMIISTRTDNQVLMVCEKIMEYLLRRNAEEEQQEQEPCGETSYDQIS